MGITKDNFDTIKPENYELIYVGELSELKEETQGATLEVIYEKFNIDHPEDYRGLSMSVSDIVVLHQNGENSAHFVDSFGFTGLSDFMQTLEGAKEQETEIDIFVQDVQSQNRRNMVATITFLWTSSPQQMEYFNFIVSITTLIKRNSNSDCHPATE